MSEKYEVIVTHPIPDEGLKDLFDRYVCHYPCGGAPYTDAQLMELMPACDAVLACGAMPARLIEAAPKLKIISNFGAGYDRVDVDAADIAGVIVTNIPDTTAESTAELAFALLIDCFRRVSALDALIRSAPPENAFGMGKAMTHNLAGATLGIVAWGGSAGGWPTWRARSACASSTITGTGSRLIWKTARAGCRLTSCSPAAARYP